MKSFTTNKEKIRFYMHMIFLPFFFRIMILTLSQDPKRSGHRGFGFVTFAEDGVAERVSRRSHEICGQQVSHLLTQSEICCYVICLWFTWLIIFF